MDLSDGFNVYNLKDQFLFIFSFKILLVVLVRTETRNRIDKQNIEIHFKACLQSKEKKIVYFGNMKLNGNETKNPKKNPNDLRILFLCTLLACLCSAFISNISVHE